MPARATEDRIYPVWTLSQESPLLHIAAPHILTAFVCERERRPTGYLVELFDTFRADDVIGGLLVSVVRAVGPSRKHRHEKVNGSIWRRTFRLSYQDRRLTDPAKALVSSFRHASRSLRRGIHVLYIFLVFQTDELQQVGVGCENLVHRDGPRLGVGLGI